MVKTERKELKPINRRKVTVRIVGISPLIQHKWNEKAEREMLLKKQGKKTKTREVCDPEQEGKDAMYLTEDGKPGVLAVAIKAAMIEAAHQDLGIPKTLVRKAVFIVPMGREVVLPLEPANGKKKVVEPVIEQDHVTVGKGSADLRYRPYFYDWAVTTTWEIDADLLTVDDLLKLLDRAGFGVGIHEWRPEKNGEYGRFRVDEKFNVRDVSL